LGLDPLRLRRRPFLHVDPEKWDPIRDKLANNPTDATAACRYDMRPGPDRPPRAATAIVESAAFIAALTGDSADLAFLRTHLDRLLPSRGMSAVGLPRGQYLAACAFAFDLLGDTLEAPAYDALGRTLADHAARTCDDLARDHPEHWPCESPGLVATFAGLNLAGLAMLPLEPDAERWLALSEPPLDTALSSVATDGWWPTGFEDWNALLPLLVRVADAWQRLAGRDRFRHGVFRESWRVALHALAPDSEAALEFDRAGVDDRPQTRARWRNEPCRWVFDRLSRRFEEPGFRAALGLWREAGLGRGTPWEALWGRSDKRRRAPSEPLHHVFATHGLATWRSAWSSEAQWLAVTTGPAYGTVSAPLWQPATPLHADANHFTFWLDGRPLIVGAGAVTEPSSTLHNTVLVNGLGQAAPHERDDAGARLAACWLSELGGCVEGAAGGCYPAAAGVTEFDRHLAVAADYLVVWDVLAAARPARFDWLLHTPGTAQALSASLAEVTCETTRLRVHLLRPERLSSEARVINVTGADEPLATRLTFTAGVPAQRTQFLAVLAAARPPATMAPNPALLTGEHTVGVRLTWSGGDCEEVLFPTQDRGIVLGHIISDAAYLALRTRADGHWRRLLARRAARVLVPGGEVLAATQPVDVALEASALEVKGEIHSPTGATVTLRCPFIPRGVMVDGVSGKARMERAHRIALVRLTAGRHSVWISGR
jgi:hypothetical protein